MSVADFGNSLWAHTLKPKASKAIQIRWIQDLNATVGLFGYDQKY
jgi:hypothetical protein